MLCFGNFPEAKKSVDKKGGDQDFPWEIFCLKVPKRSAGVNLLCCASGFFASEKVYGGERGRSSSFFVEFSSVTLPKLFLGGSLLVFQQFQVSKRFV